jgi:HTH-type transcriptional regulator, transcriptional repressor of NAD biosynthesis genes
VSGLRHALVVGKFYPPHAGHECLIRAAAHHAAQVSVIAMAASSETLTLEERVAWLREIFTSLPQVRVVGVRDDAPIDYASDAVWTAHVELMREGVRAAEKLRAHAAGPVDAVFSSEDYGAELGRRFGAAAVYVDRERALYPVSGTAVRADLAAHWHALAAPVRGGLCHRLVIVGAESTGKTTLARELTARLAARGAAWARTRWIGEYGREYTVSKWAAARAASGEPVAVADLVWSTPEFETIALEQQRWEDAAARESSPVLICDTDAFATEIWHERYVGARSDSLVKLAARVTARRSYLLTDWRDVPFEDDGLRDGEHIRAWMHETFAARLHAQPAPWRVVEGTLESRLSQALEWVEQHARF